MNLLKLTDSTYLSLYGTQDGGSHILDKLKTVDFSKYEVDEESLNYICGILERKITAHSKSEVLYYLKNDMIKLILADEKINLPTYMTSFPIIINGKLVIYLNISKYSKFKDNTIQDIDPRILYSLLLFSLTQYKIYKTPMVLSDIAISDHIHKIYKLIITKIMNKIININTLTVDEKLQYDLITSIYISNVLLRKNPSDTIKYVSNLYKNTANSIDRINTELENIDSNSITSLSSYVDYLKKHVVSFNRLSLPHLIKEYAITMKNQAILSIDLVQIFVPMIVSVSFGSYGNFNDKFLSSLFNTNNTINKLADLMLKK